MTKPVIDIGKIGAWWLMGANVCSVLDMIRWFIYYIGWIPSTTVHTRNSIDCCIWRQW
jgi:hypothetical protein